MESTLPPYRPLGMFRLFLAGLVAVQHYGHWVFGRTTSAAMTLVEPGNIAVLIFFAISGLVIAEAGESVYRDRPVAFLANRLLRILPLYWGAILVSFFVIWALSTAGLPITDEAAIIAAAPLSPRNALANLLAVFPLPGRFQPAPDFPFLRIAWALRVEMAFYLAFALAIAGAKLLGTTSLRQVVFAGSLALLAGDSLVIVLALEANPLWQFVPYFVFGLGLYYFAEGNRRSLLLLIPAALVALFETARSATATGLFLFVALAGILVSLALASSRSWMGADRAAGDLSYPVYVGHWLPLLVFAMLMPATGNPRLLAAVCALTGFVLLPLAYFVAIDLPVRLVRRRIRGMDMRARNAGEVERRPWHRFGKTGSNNCQGRWSKRRR